MISAADILHGNILIVDDQEANVRLLERMLRGAGYDAIASTTDPNQVCALHRAHRYDLILLDLQMPGLDGFQVMEGLKDIETGGYLPVLVITAQPDHKLRALKAGAKDFISTPFDLAEVLIRVHNLLDVRLLHNELRDLNQTLEERVVECTGEVQRLNDELKRSFTAAIRMLSELAEMQGAILGRHAKRVTGMVKAMADLIGLRGDELYRLEIAALIHDIGKVGLPPPLLSKSPERMTAAEQALYLAHAVKGEIIAQMVPNLREASQLIRNHHERFNGSGYPDRLRGAAIPFGARMIAVADGYDWHLYERLQLGVSTPEKALAHVQAHATTWYDPELVSVLAACVSHPSSAVHEYEVVEVRRQDLREGMVPSRDVHVGGQIVLARNKPLRRTDLARLNTSVDVNPFDDGFYIYHRKPVTGR